MSWFTTLCRQTGLFIHHLVKPVKEADRGHRTVVGQTKQEKKISRTVTLRRTTIEEVELKKRD